MTGSFPKIKVYIVTNHSYIKYFNYRIMYFSECIQNSIFFEIAYLSPVSLVTKIPYKNESFDLNNVVHLGHSVLFIM